MEYSGGGPEEILGWYSGGPGVILGWSSWVGHLLSVEEDRASSAVPRGPPGDPTEASGKVQEGFGEDSWSIQGVILSKSSGNTRVVLGCSWGGPGLVVLGWSSSERGGGSRIIRLPPGDTRGSNGGFREGSGRIRGGFMEYSGGGPEKILGWSWGDPGVVLGWSSWVGHLVSVKEDRVSSADPPGAPGDPTEDSGSVQEAFGEDSWSIQGVFLRKSSGDTRVILGWATGDPGLVVLGWSSSDRGG